MIDRAVDRLADLYKLIWKPFFWLLVVIDIIWFILFYTNNLIISFSFFVFILLQILLSITLDKRKKRKIINSFIPGKPEKDGIRYLRGKRAKDYQIAWDSTNTYLIIGDFRKFFLEKRLYLANLAGLPKNYFYERHRYDPASRRIIDLFMVDFNEHKQELDSSNKIRFINKLRFKYLKFKYRREDKRIEHWMQITSCKKKRVVFVWHEDIDKYKAIYNKNKRKKAKTA